MPDDALEQRILVLTPTGRDSVATTELLQRAGLATQICQNLTELIAHLGEGAASALISEEALTSEGYNTLVEWVDAQPAWSD